MTQINANNLQSFVDLVEYDYSTGTMMFSMDLHGYMIPVSMLQVKLEPTDTYFPANLHRLNRLYGITTEEVLRGIETCRHIHGYS